MHREPHPGGTCARTRLTFSPPLKLHPDRFVDVLGEVQDALLLLLLLILQQRSEGKAGLKRSLLPQPNPTQPPLTPLPSWSTQALFTPPSLQHRYGNHPEAATDERGARGAAARRPPWRRSPLLTAILPAPPPPPPPPPPTFAISFAAARSDVASRVNTHWLAAG